ncbi:Alpha-methylacyl-CoA racemase [Manis javanica]|nr:Alpha-methylacyl-CoA racemase [Manis javanica]
MTKSSPYRPPAGRRCAYARAGRAAVHGPAGRPERRGRQDPSRRRATTTAIGPMNNGERAVHGDEPQQASLVLDLKHPRPWPGPRDGGQADVVVENFRPRGRTPGHEAQAVRALNPRLVYVSVSVSARPGRWPTGRPTTSVQAAGGLMEATGRRRSAHREQAVSDVVAGLFAS